MWLSLISQVNEEKDVGVGRYNRLCLFSNTHKNSWQHLRTQLFGSSALFRSLEQHSPRLVILKSYIDGSFRVERLKYTRHFILLFSVY